MFIGLLQPQPNAKVQPICSTGICRFEEKYITLGVCSRCAEISNLLLITDSNNGSETQLSQCHSPPCDYSLSTSPYNITLHGQPEATNIEASTEIPLLHPDLASIQGAVNFTAIEALGPNKTNISAIECTVYYCALQMSGTIGVLQGDKNSLIENQTILDADLIRGTKSWSLTPRLCDNKASQPALQNFCPYEIDFETSGRFSSTIQAILDNETIRDHLHSNGVEASFKSLATLLTNHFRTNKEICQGFAYGRAYSWKTAIDRQMVFFIPLGLYVGLSMIFLLGVIWRGRHYHVWKSSSLPLLFASLTRGPNFDSNHDSPLSPGLRMKDMEAAAKRVTVHMDDSDGIKLTPYVEEKAATK